jgi:glycosyltransferase involved in cell wall biosynthesis
MKTIAIIITKLYGGGAERAAANLSMELSELYNVKLIVFDGENQVYPYGGELIDLKLPPKKGKIGKIFNALKRYLLVKRIKQKYNVDCTISLMDGPNLINTLSKRSDKVIISIRNYMSLAKKEKIFLTKLITKFILNRADKVVSVAKAVELDLINNFGAREHKTYTINNYCDSNRILNNVNKGEVIDIVNFEREVKYLVTAGRLTRQKGHWHLLRVFKKVLDTMPNTKLIILGTGEYEIRLKQLAKDLGIEDKVIMPGYVKNPHDIISKCDIFVLPSLFEGFSNALLEALACEVAIISSDCDSGSREILAPNTPFDVKTDKLEYAKYGIITPVCDGGHFNADDPLISEEKVLLDAICKMLTNDRLRDSYAEKANERVRDFTPEIITAKWRTLIEESCG